MLPVVLTIIPESKQNNANWSFDRFFSVLRNATGLLLYPARPPGSASRFSLGNMNQQETATGL